MQKKATICDTGTQLYAKGTLMQLQYIDAKGMPSSIEVPPGTKAFDLADKLNLKGPHQAVSVSINNKILDLDTPLNEGDLVRFYSFDDSEGKEVFWHTSAHVLAQAILRLYPNAKPTIGPPIENGFYYDFADLKISDEDFDRIEKEMQAICEENFISQRYVFKSKEEAVSRFNNNRYKQELIQGIPDGETLSGYTQGEFFDFCRGPHLSRLGKIKALKILKTSGAYWRGDSKNEMLTRIYAISFPDRKLLKDYLHKLEEAKKRDHKIIGPKLDLFSLKEEGPGMPFIHPKGMIVWNRLLEYWRECHKKAGYVEIKTPSLMIKELWERSGHWANYREHMYTCCVEEREFAVKPMNCPGAMLFYKTKKHSYRELPWRVAEIGHVHRFEPSGSLSGLFRVRCFHQDDAHIFMQPEDIQSEIFKILSLVDEMYSTFGLTYEIALSTRPATNTIGSDEAWEMTTNALKQALIAFNKPYLIQEGDGAFYGPKIDLRVHDALGRSWQCGTIQLDMSLPERFELEYTAPDGSLARPIMLHRVIYGSIERFFGSLIEFYAGRFPLWLSPSQVAIIAVADRHVPYGNELAQGCAAQGYEVHVDDSNESVSKKVREAQLAQYNYILTIGDKELENKTVNVRTRDNEIHGEMTLTALLEVLNQERRQKSLQSPLSKTKASQEVAS
jgi:threonyl-tRNA synthetase